MTDNAGYCMAVTATRGGMRILAIVLGEKEGKVRNKETADLLDYGFNNYEIVKVKNKNEKVGEIIIDKAIPSRVDVKVNRDITVLQKKKENVKEYKSEVKLDDVVLPLKKGDKVGILLVKNNNNIIKQVDLYSDTDIKKRSFINLWLNQLKSFITGDIV